MADIKWIKLRVDMFDDEKIKIIQSLPDGDSVLVIWIRLIALAGKCNTGGLVLIEDEFPYTNEMLATIFNKPIATVNMALQVFEKYRMIENTDRGIYITNFEKHQNIDGMEKIKEQNRIRKQRERERKKALLLEESGQEIPTLPDGGTGESADGNGEVTNMSRDVSREVTQQKKNKKKNIYNTLSTSVDRESADGPLTDEASDPDPPKEERIMWSRIMEDYNATCLALPKIQAVSDGRKTKIRTLLNEFRRLKILPDKSLYEILHTLFSMAQESDFLSGRNGKWGGCKFDWIINKANALKIIEGTYTDGKGGGGYAGNGGDARAGNNGGNGGGNGGGTSGDTTSAALERFRRNNGGLQV